MAKHYTLALHDDGKMEWYLVGVYDDIRDAEKAYDDYYLPKNRHGTLALLTGKGMSAGAKEIKSKAF